MQAPKGGMISVVNGQRYEGGEFMPDHGLYCGTGKNRVTTAQFETVAAAATAKGMTLRYSEQFERFELWRLVRFSDGTLTEQLHLTARTLSTLAKCVA